VIRPIPGCHRPPTAGGRLDLTRCPDPVCGAPAEVANRWTLGSTSGALSMAHTICLNRHIFVLPERWLPVILFRI
jgi:hypothetical protein